jgi:diaminohydroxyphosphoribosylaminopyrimidine deaminase/5-amino-6-(5-phosphoribosylamino)uracil reductase
VSGDDLGWITLALGEAEKGRGSVEPNPMVGAVVVRDGQVVGLGHHARFGGPHAEVAALSQAGEAARGATLYVTLEPCCHHGKTPPCTGAIVEAGVARVVAAMRDPFPAVDGGGVAALRAAGIPVSLGLQALAAAELNAPYLKRVSTGLPYVTAKWAMTLDGKTATAWGDSQWISSEGSRALVHKLRGRMDAIVVGIGTALTDDPLLTARPPGPRTPVRIVLDSRAALPAASRLVRTAREVPVLVAVTDEAPGAPTRRLQDAGCELLLVPGPAPVRILPLLRELGRRGMTNVLVEGGGRVLGSFLDEGQVDEVEIYIAPILEGGDHAFTPARGRGSGKMSQALRLDRVVTELVEGDVRLKGTVDRAWRSIIARLGDARHPVDS